MHHTHTHTHTHIYIHTHTHICTDSHYILYTVNRAIAHKAIKVQYNNLSILDTLGPNNTVLIIEVSLFERFINTHLYCIGTDTTCPDYRGVLI